MFVNAEGMSNRPPIQWSYPLRALAYSHPYILGLSDDVIMVYRYLVWEIEFTQQKFANILEVQENFELCILYKNLYLNCIESYLKSKVVRRILQPEGTFLEYATGVVKN